MAKTAQNVTHAENENYLELQMWSTRYSERGERSCTRSIDFYAWPKTRFQPRMRGIRKCPVLQMWATGLVRGVSVRASGRWYFMRGKNGSKGHACEISNQLFHYSFRFYTAKCRLFTTPKICRFKATDYRGASGILVGEIRVIVEILSNIYVHYQTDVHSL